MGYRPERALTPCERMFHAALWTMVVDALDNRDEPPRDILGDDDAEDAYNNSLAEISTMSNRFVDLCMTCNLPARELRDKVCSGGLTRKMALRYLRAVMNNE